MKIAFIGQRGIPCRDEVSQHSRDGQVERNVEEMSVRLVERGHEVFVYTESGYTPREYKRYEGVRLISIPQIKWDFLNRFVYYLVACFRACFIEKAQVIHWQKRKAIAWGFFVRLMRANMRQVVSIDVGGWRVNGVSQNFYSFVFPLLNKVQDQIVVNSASLQRYFLQRYNLSTKLVVDGVSLGDEPMTDLRTLRQLGLQREKYIVFKNEGEGGRGLNCLIDAFLKVKSKSLKWRDFKLVIVGSPNFDYDKKRWLALMGKGDVVMVGDQSKLGVRELLAHAFLTIYPDEVHLGSVLEVMGYGRAVLVADLRCNLEMINSGLTKATAFDFRYQDVEDLANKLELLFLNPEVIKSVGRQARQYVSLYHNWDDVVAEIERVYRRMALVSDLRTKVFRVPELLRV